LFVRLFNDALSTVQMICRQTRVIISTLHQRLWEWPDQRGWDGERVWCRWEMHTKLYEITSKRGHEGPVGYFLW